MNHLPRMPREFLNEPAMLADIRVGDSAYCVPWALTVDRQRRAYLNLGHTAHSKRAGTAKLLVMHRRDGFWVLLPEGERWTRSESASGEPVVGFC